MIAVSGQTILKRRDDHGKTKENPGSRGEERNRKENAQRTDSRNQNVKRHSLNEKAAQHLRALDRKRLNGVGIKKLGFIERAYELALENSEFLPHYVTIDRFRNDLEYFMDFRSLTDLVAQIREKLWNITIQSADIAYTDALEFYSSVREASKRRVDSAETLYGELAVFFKSHGRRTADSETAPTKKQALRDFKALEQGKHDGVLVIENRSPKMTGGKRKIVDETFRDTAEFKESEQGGIKE